MILKAKHVLLLGAFIVLTLLGYRCLPRDEIVFQTDEGEVSSLFENAKGDLSDKLLNDFQNSSQNGLHENLQGGLYENLQDSVIQDFNNGEMIFVHIEGAVNFPGIKEVRKGTRLFEVIEVSGGTTLDADVSKVNLASIVKDEQKIYIPFLVKEIDINSSEANKNSSNFNSDGYNSNANEYNYNNDFAFGDYELVNLNYATEEDLQRLDGIGPSMARKIIEYREQNGYFSSVEDIKSVSGIGEAKYNKIKDDITV